MVIYMQKVGSEESCIKKFVRWLIERTGASEFTKTIIPRHALHPMYSFGGLASLMFFLLALTGIIQLMFYVPAFGEENIAYESVRHFTESVPYGFVMRGIHSYAATLMILLSMLHFIRVYFTGAYAKPKELTYVVGIIAGLLSVLSAFLGYSLRMDHISVEAVRIAQFLVLQLPGGSWLYSLIFGSGAFDEIIPRFLAFHIGIAGLLAIVLLLHFYMIHAHHISPPYDGSEPEPVIPFPNFLLTELTVTVVIIGVLVTFSAAFPPDLGFKFVFGEELPVGQPEWYLMAIYALIKTGIDPVMAGFVIPSIGLSILVIMPWVDPLYSRHPRNRRIATTYGLIFLGEYIMFFLYGQLTPGEQIPLLNALLLAIAVALIMGYIGIKLTSKPVPPKKTQKIQSNGSQSYAVRVLLKNIWWIAGLLLIFAIVLGGLGVMSHLSENYYEAATFFGSSIILMGWSMFAAKVGLVDAKYLV